MIPKEFKALPFADRLDEVERRLAIGDTRAEIREALGITRFELSHLCRISRELEDTTKQLIEKNGLSEGHAKALTRTSGRLQDDLIRSAIQHRWSVRRLEQEVRAGLSGTDSVPDQEHYDRISQLMSETIGHPVTVRPDKKDQRKGTITIQYFDFESFDSIADRLNVSLDEL